MNYTVLFTASARNTFLYLRITYPEPYGGGFTLSRINSPTFCRKKLKGFSNLYHIRVSDSRIAYTIDDSLRRIEITRIDLRENIYR